MTNEKFGGVSAVENWPGSEQLGLQPTYFRKFEMFYPFKRRVDNLVRFLTRDANLGLLYYEEPDFTGHKFGPESKEMDQKLVQLDRFIGYFIAKMEEAGLYNQTNIIITSDHGMASVDKAKVVTIPGDILKLIDLGKSRFTRMTGLIYPKSDQVYPLLQKLQEKHKVLKVWKKSEIPTRFHYTHNSRIPPILITVKLPYSLKTSRLRFKKGDHGWFLPENGPSDMYPFFLARGPDILKSSMPLEPFENVSVYPLCCQLLKIPPAANNGTLEYLSNYLLN